MTRKLSIVKVDNIVLVEKDVIHVRDVKSFAVVWARYFESSVAFDLNGTLYLIGSEVAYCYKEELFV